MPVNAAEERFLQSQASRQAARTQGGEEDNNKTQGLTKEFWAIFSAKHHAIKTLIAGAGKIQPAVTSSQRLAGEKKLAEIITLIQQDLIQSTALASSYLVDHDVGRGTKIGEDELRNVEAIRAKIIPREKFRFKCRDKYSVKKVAVRSNDENDNGSSNLSEVGESEVEVNGIYDKESETIVMSEEFGPTNPSVSQDYYTGDFRVRNCSNCVITLPNAFGALRLQDLTNCTVYSGPVSGPCYVEDCKNCVFVVASRQLRIHDTYDTSFFVNVKAGPIIEDCCRTKFGRYNITFRNKNMKGKSIK